MTDQKSRSDAANEDGSQVVEALGQLKSLLDDAGHLAKVLENNARLVIPRPDEQTQIQSLQERIREAENDQEELVAQLVEAERQAGKLTSLYVATYQLHASLDPAEVRSAIAEITRDLLGAATFVLLIQDENEGEYEVALAYGDVAAESRFGAPSYDGGDALVDAALTDGHLRLERATDSEALAVVPLRVEDSVVGALVILAMLDHKKTPLSEDRDILDLLAAHAASALVAARIYSKTHRKLETLQGLVGLLRGS